MKLPMCIVMGHRGIRVTYKCLEFLHTRNGRKCPDKDTDKCLKCEYSRAEMSGFDATRLLNAFGARREE